MHPSTEDQRFLVKTMRKSEMRVLLGLLPRYCTHVASNPDTLITRFFGLHRIRVSGGTSVGWVRRAALHCSACASVGWGRRAALHLTRHGVFLHGCRRARTCLLAKHHAPHLCSLCVHPLPFLQVRFVVMANIFVTDLQIHRRYDIKGSTDGRTAGGWAIFMMCVALTLSDNHTAHLATPPCHTQHALSSPQTPNSLQALPPPTTPTPFSKTWTSISGWPWSRARTRCCNASLHQTASCCASAA